LIYHWLFNWEKCNIIILVDIKNKPILKINFICTGFKISNENVLNELKMAKFSFINFYSNEYIIRMIIDLLYKQRW
jgi:hypothetical protein